MKQWSTYMWKGSRNHEQDFCCDLNIFNVHSAIPCKYMREFLYILIYITKKGTS
jgi:hypothetical protein